MIINWNDWVGKKVSLKLEDEQTFSFSEILAYEEPFISLTDKTGLPTVINTLSIIKIKEESDGRK